jgi:hypothetical protein
MTIIKGDMFHFKDIGTSIYKVTFWHVIDNDIELFFPNHNDNLSHLTMKNVEGTNSLWEEGHLRLNNE